ncbi:hypothetical protein [Thiothrix nivea]|uniref:Uncharacterized protein n=1 Tax=Thiothrix nivea (strain ATCC 35100 / DSM 5205 / JP2) TaxID=870187 RepID=A0A656HPJ9_THINJ|nr:hypothetical protein [Thiothrix nivea]EIJ36985.1 hypothetical protein Thini_4511 [Thiothrix nivea DSM 5205]
MRKLTHKDNVMSVDYECLEQNEDGNLHELMKALVNEMRYNTDIEMTHPAIFKLIEKLEIEVKYHKPANPPFRFRKFM